MIALDALHELPLKDMEALWDDLSHAASWILMPQWFQEVPQWLQKPNRGFGGRTPWALIQAGERDLIWAMIHQTQQGTFA